MLGVDLSGNKGRDLRAEVLGARVGSTCGGLWVGPTRSVNACTNGRLRVRTARSVHACANSGLRGNLATWLVGPASACSGLWEKLEDGRETPACPHTLLRLTARNITPIETNFGISSMTPSTGLLIGNIQIWSVRVPTIIVRLEAGVRKDLRCSHVRVRIL